jgi:dTDP-4-dehydrorhamnose 3,5-epimerase
MKVEVRPLALPGPLLVRAARITDRRGYFCETYSRAAFAAAGIACEFVQDNQSGSVAAGTVRGLHFQTPPAAQAKLVRVLKGRIFDVAVDLRRSSPGYGRHVGLELAEDSGEQIFIPAGFAHGFCSLVPNTEVSYKVDAAYSPEHDRGLYWADPALGIRWPIEHSAAVLSEKDQTLPMLSALPTFFT